MTHAGWFFADQGLPCECVFTHQILDKPHSCANLVCGYTKLTALTQGTMGILS